MAHRRVKNIDFEDDDYYEDYYDNQDDTKLPPDSSLTEEERGKLRTSADEVRVKLGTQSDGILSEQRIKEELWNSWYDVDSVVAKLRRKYSLCINIDSG
jgi:elongation factor 1 alpha-like protein